MSGEGMRFRYTGIRVTDPDRSVKFYTRHFGIRAVWRSKIPQTSGEMVVLRDDGDHALELNTYRDGKKYTNGDDLDHLAFEVEDFQVVYDELRRGGVELAWGRAGEPSVDAGLLQESRRDMAGDLPDEDPPSGEVKK